ncbi:MAG: tRNA pseudouridine synthase A [Phycisphaeraceae bacterium]|nr:MAG: tRNA pseudouridine synthase A [Phycisphaeraceae bacterium]
MPPVRYKLTLAYDGTEFHGWQKQEPPASEHPELVDQTPDDIAEGRVAMRTVQHVVERAVRSVCREAVTIKGASRTDSGVHAGGHYPDGPPEFGKPGGQVAAFTTNPDPAKGVGWPVERGTEALVRALNSELPRDVLCLGAEAVPLDFDPIGGAVAKEYTYAIVSGRTRPLWDRRYVFHTWHDLELEPMQAAAALLVGEHDFEAFAQASHGRKTTVRRVFACGVEGTGDRGSGIGGGTPSASLRSAPPPSVTGEERFLIRVSGSGFLYNMVRIIAGTLMEVGRGRIDPNRIPEIIESRDRRQAGPTLPPQGLRLEWIRYGEGVNEP